MAAGPKTRSIWVLGRGPTVAAALAGLLVVVSGFIAFNQTREALRSANWVRHTLQVLRQSALLQGVLVDAETGQRGYLLTGEPQYLGPYERAEQTYRSTLDGLRSLTLDSPDQQQRVTELQGLGTSKFAELAETIRLRDKEGPEAALRVVRTNAGMHFMDEIRELIDAMTKHEAALLTERLDTRERQTGYALASTLVFSLLSILTFGTVIVALNRSARGRLEAAAAVRESEERLRVTLRSIGDGVIATNADGDVVFMNPLAQTLTGWREIDARGLPVEQVFHIVNEITRETVESPVAKVMREGMVVGLANHTVLIARDGAEKPIDDSGAPIRDGDGELMGVVLVFRDVTARRLSEEARVQLMRTEAARDAALAASRAKDEFLAIVSHELRSPLNAAVNWLELLRSGSLDDTMRARALDTIERNLRLQAALTGDLLDVAQIVSGKLTIDRVPLDVAELVREAVDDKRDLAREKRLTVEFSSRSPLLAVADPMRLGQVLANLLSNAIKYTPEGGSIVVSLREVEGSIEITVRDTGRGIASEFLPHVFERFRQADGSLVRGYGGLGLGLAISKHIVEQHGGNIAAESAGEGRGATFRVVLPADVQPGAPEPRRVSEGERGMPAGMRILVVEDHEDTREALSHMLRTRGASTDVAGSTREAIDRFDSQPPDLLLSDIGLPVENGFSLIREIRTRDKELRRHTLAIAITGFGREEDRREALAAGFDGYVQKPVEFTLLIQTIARLRSARDLSSPQ